MLVARRLQLRSGGGGSFTPPLPITPFELFALAGAGTEVTGPRAIYDGVDRTFIGWVTGNSNPNDIEVAAYVHSTGAVEGPVLLSASVSGGATTTPDSHVGPALEINGAGHLVVAWMPHGSTTGITVKISTNPIGSGWEASGFGSPITFTPIANSLTYPQLAYCSVNDRLYLFFRRLNGSTAQLVRCHSDDGGETWSGGTVVYTSSGDNEYSAFACNGIDRIDFAITDDEPAQAGGFGLFHFSMDAVSGDLNAADGSLLIASGSLPAVPSDLTELVSSSGDQYPYAMAFDESGNPVIAWQTKNQDPVLFGEFRYGGSWVETQIGDSEPISPTILTVGGGHHVWSNTDHYIHGRVVSGVQTIWHYRRVAGTWNSGVQVTTTETTPHSPFQVKNNAPALASLWTIGLNASDDDFDPGLQGLPIAA